MKKRMFCRHPHEYRMTFPSNHRDHCLKCGKMFVWSLVGRFWHPVWLSHDVYRYNEKRVNWIMLDFDPFRCRTLVAPRWYKPLLIYFRVKRVLYRFRAMVFRRCLSYAERKHWIVINAGEMLTLATLRSWRRNAIRTHKND